MEVPTENAPQPAQPAEPAHDTVPLHPYGDVPQAAPAQPAPADPLAGDPLAAYRRPEQPAATGTLTPSPFDAPTSNTIPPNGQPGGGFPPFIPSEPSGYPTPRPPSRSRGPWIAALGAVVLIAALVAMFAIGHATGSSATTTGSPNGQTAPTVAVPPAAQDLQQTVIAVIHTVQPSVVEVTSSGGQGEAIGSGVVYSSSGSTSYIVTNDHVVTGFNSYVVTLSNGNRNTATLVGEDPQDDLAVLKVNAALQPLSLANSSNVQVGQFAIAVGNPLGLQQSATFGIVSALNRTASEAPSGPAGTLTGLIQTSAPINHGNSGGALVNLQGQLIGIPTLGAVDSNSGGAAEGIGFAIPSNRVKYVADQLIQHGKLTQSGQGFLGVEVRDVTAGSGLPTDHGVVISGFANDASGKSPAQAAGLQTGDIIIAVNGQSISDNNDLAAALQSQAPGTQVSLTIVRGSSQQTIVVTLGERPTNLQG